LKLREVEIGGVWNLGNYENLKLSLRYEVESEGEIAKVVDIVGKASLIVAVLRRLYDEHNRRLAEMDWLHTRISELKSALNECHGRLRREVEELLEKYSNVLKPEVIEEVKARLESGEYKVCIEKLSKIAECERLPNCGYYEEEYKRVVERLNEVGKEVNEVIKAIGEIRRILWRGDLEGAYDEAVKYMNQLKISGAGEAEEP